jgi:hypothetical protein
MNQNIWGSHLWFSLHTITFTYPITPTLIDQNNFKNFFVSLQNVIPCSICQKNYKRHLLEHPIDKHLNSRKDLVYWLIDIHNMVNSEIGKKFMSYDVIIKKYENVYQKDLLHGINIENNTHNNKNDINDNKFNKNKYNIEYIILLILIIIFVIFITRIPKNSLIYP